MGRLKINMGDFEIMLREQVIKVWRDVDQIHPHEAHPTSRVMRTYHTHFGTPIGTQLGWWDDKKRERKPSIPPYLRLNIPSHLSRALSRLRLSSHTLNVEILRHKQKRIPYELRICNKCDWHCVQDEEHVLLDCPSPDLTDLRSKHQNLFSFPCNSPARLRLYSPGRH